MAKSRSKGGARGPGATRAKPRGPTTQPAAQPAAGAAVGPGVGAAPAAAAGTQVRVVKLPVPDIPTVVTQMSDAMLLSGFHLCGTFVYLDHLVLVYQ
jgi:hypothetical protein